LLGISASGWLVPPCPESRPSCCHRGFPSGHYGPLRTGSGLGLRTRCFCVHARSPQPIVPETKARALYLSPRSHVGLFACSPALLHLGGLQSLVVEGPILSYPPPDSHAVVASRPLKLLAHRTILVLVALLPPLAKPRFSFVDYMFSLHLGYGEHFGVCLGELCFRLIRPPCQCDCKGSTYTAAPAARPSLNSSSTVLPRADPGCCTLGIWGALLNTSLCGYRLRTFPLAPGRCLLHPEHDACLGRRLSTADDMVRLDFTFFGNWFFSTPSTFPYSAQHIHPVLGFPQTLPTGR
jgi:hypothetical protein